MLSLGKFYKIFITSPFPMAARTSQRTLCHTARDDRKWNDYLSENYFPESLKLILLRSHFLVKPSEEENSNTGLRTRYKFHVSGLGFSWKGGFFTNFLKRNDGFDNTLWNLPFFDLDALILTRIKDFFNRVRQNIPSSPFQKLPSYLLDDIFHHFGFYYGRDDVFRKPCFPCGRYEKTHIKLLLAVGIIYLNTF